MMINEGQKIKLRTDEIARIVEVFNDGEAFMAEVFKFGGGIDIQTIMPIDIASVFVENEIPIEKYAVS